MVDPLNTEGCEMESPLTRLGCLIGLGFCLASWDIPELFLQCGRVHYPRWSAAAVTGWMRSVLGVGFH